MFGLLLTDLDGTLLRDDHCTFSERTANALLRLKASGAKLCACTGRVQCTLPYSVTELFDYAITCNGAACRDLRTGETLFSAYLSEFQARTAWDICRCYHPFTAWYVNGEIILDQAHYDMWPQRMTSVWHREYMKKGLCKIYPDIELFFEEGVPQLEKINLSAYPQQEHALICEALRRTGLFEFASSSSSNIEITDLRADKGKALRALCEKLSIPLEYSIAFGDGNNDLSMMNAAGKSVAMGNAIQEVREAADEITLSNEEDGLAVYLETHL